MQRALCMGVGLALAPSVRLWFEWQKQVGSNPTGYCMTIEQQHAASFIRSTSKAFFPRQLNIQVFWVQRMRCITNKIVRHHPELPVSGA